MIRAAAICCVLAATAATAQEFTVSDGPLSDDEFYRAVACRAALGRPCMMDYVRWRAEDARDLTISLFQTHLLFPTGQILEVSNQIDAAIAEINDVEGDLKLRRIADGADAHITFYLWNTVTGGRIENIGLKDVDGATMDAAYVRVFWNGNRELTRSVIVISRDILTNDIPSILLEELTQSLGLLGDIRNPWYETRSIFSQDSNFVTRLGVQDRMVLERHYPLTKD